ncbi:YcgL domain-containing protein [Glaciecola siphonariae]|uniref:YcgL domain-containing protein ACFO4O_06300 n=1 Tax=Glaciecola siphonariae TaxID=521012 RepID=A0ABV9LUR4_9ALTE
MKLCAVYKSSKKADTYLYVQDKGDYSKVPNALLNAFGTPVFVMLLPIAKRITIAQLPRDKFVSTLERDGFYLQMPPKVESLLAAHREQQGLDGKLQRD